MASYIVVDAKPYDPGAHRPGTVGHDGNCGLHGCGEPAVATIVGEDKYGGHIELAVCERGVEEYGLRERFAC